MQQAAGLGCLLPFEQRYWRRKDLKNIIVIANLGMFRAVKPAPLVDTRGSFNNLSKPGNPFYVDGNLKVEGQLKFLEKITGIVIDSLFGKNANADLIDNLSDFYFGEESEMSQNCRKGSNGEKLSCTNRGRKRYR